MWSYRIRFKTYKLIPHPTTDSFALIGTSRPNYGLNDTFRSEYTADSLVTLFGVDSSQPIRSYSIPFTLRGAIWFDPNPRPNPYMDAPSCSYSLLAVTSKQTTVLLGDDVTAHLAEGSAAREITSAGDAYTKPTLFQDIFGKSAFANMEERGQTSKVDVSRSLPDLPLGSKRVDLSLLDGPAHLLPPIGSLFDSLIGSFTNTASPAVTGSSAAQRTEEVEDVIMEEEATRELPGVQYRARNVSEEEMTLVTDLFRRVLSAPPTLQPQAQTPTPKHINGIAAQSNGKSHGQHTPIYANGKGPRTPTTTTSTPSASPTPGKVPSSKARKPPANGTPSALRNSAVPLTSTDSPASASASPTIGQKRKKSHT